MPTISVVVPVYKVEKYLNRCVDSILNQTYKNFELILVDDGSPDKAPEICDDYASKYDFVHVIHQKNGGLSAARNSGIVWAFKNSDSQWITFIDSDDWVHPEYLYSLLKANLENKTQISAGQICVTNKYEINTTESPNKRISVKRTEDVYTNEAFDPNSACSRLFYKKLFENIRFPVAKLHEDRFTTYKLYFQFKTMSVVDFPIYYYFENSEGIVHAQWNVGKMDNLEAAEQQIEFFRNSGNEEMYEYILRDYIHLLVYNLKCLKGQKQFSRYEKTVRKKLQKTLLEHKERLKLSFDTDFNTYKYAYPLKAKIYRRIKR